MEISRAIESLKKENEEKLKEVEKLQKLQHMFPSIKKHVGRWKKVVFYTKDVNPNVVGYDCRYNCGCCPDSSLEIWPFIEVSEIGKIYSDPPCFVVGERDEVVPKPYKEWDKQMRLSGIPEEIISKVSKEFENPDDIETIDFNGD